jgi:acyl-CoA thioesterase-2
MSDAAPRPKLTPDELVARLKALLELEEIDTDLYRGPRLPEGRGRVFGGQVIAQALRAAMHSIGEGRVCHSLHAYFLRAGDDALPIIYRVERDFEGKSFANRRVIATQRGQAILNMAASFQVPEEGLSHQVEMPDVAPPEALVSEAELLRQEREEKGGPEPIWFSRPQPIEIRPVQARPMFSPEKREPHFACWFRVVADAGDDPDVHRAILAYASDMRLLATSMLPHGVSWATPGMQTASLDHALWMHQDARTDDWLLFTTDSPWSGHARGFNRGQIFDRAGRLVASVTQEGLIRRRPVS